MVDYYHSEASGRMETGNPDHVTRYSVADGKITVYVPADDEGDTTLRYYRLNGETLQECNDATDAHVIVRPVSVIDPTWSHMLTIPWVFPLQVCVLCANDINVRQKTQAAITALYPERAVSYVTIGAGHGSQECKIQIEKLHDDFERECATHKHVRFDVFVVENCPFKLLGWDRLKAGMLKYGAKNARVIIGFLPDVIVPEIQEMFSKEFTSLKITRSDGSKSNNILYCDVNDLEVIANKLITSGE